MCALSGCKPRQVPLRPRRLKVELQSLGLNWTEGSSGRRGGAGPAEGHAIQVDGLVYTVPIASPFVALSPYSAIPQTDGFFLAYRGEPLTKLEVLPRPGFYDRRDEDGTPFHQLALLHGRDCLASTVDQRCVFWKTPARCRFCGIELSHQRGATAIRKAPASLARLARTAKELDGARHVTLTTGTPGTPDAGAGHLAACAQAMKAASGLPTHAQLSPPRDPDALKILKDAGVDTIGIHIEVWDETALAYFAPAKHALGRKKFLAAWREAVRLFGAGQVSSFLIAGLDESTPSFLDGVRQIADLGVFPYIVPLRPIPGSLLAESRPPAPEIMLDLYEAAGEILRERGLSAVDSKAGCVRCGACSAIGEFI